MSLSNTTSSILTATSGSNPSKLRPFITRRPKPITPAPVQPENSAVSTMAPTTGGMSFKVPRPLSAEMKFHLHILRSFQAGPIYQPAPEMVSSSFHEDFASYSEKLSSQGGSASASGTTARPIQPSSILKALPLPPRVISQGPTSYFDSPSSTEREKRFSFASRPQSFTAKPANNDKGAGSGFRFKVKHTVPAHIQSMIDDFPPMAMGIVSLSLWAGFGSYWDKLASQENPMELDLESDEQQQPTTAPLQSSISKENGDPSIDKHHFAFKTLEDKKREAAVQRTQLREHVGVVPQLGCPSMFDKGLMDFQKDVSTKSGPRRTNATEARKRRPLNEAPNGMTRNAFIRFS